jgi:hypothetical protein
MTSSIAKHPRDNRKTSATQMGRLRLTSTLLHLRKADGSPIKHQIFDSSKEDDVEIYHGHETRSLSAIHRRRLNKRRKQRERAKNAVKSVGPLSLLVSELSSELEQKRSLISLVPFFYSVFSDTTNRFSKSLSLSFPD